MARVHPRRNGRGGESSDRRILTTPSGNAGPDLVTHTGHGDDTLLPHTAPMKHWQLSHHLPPAVIEEREAPDPMFERGLSIGSEGNGRTASESESLQG